MYEVLHDDFHGIAISTVLSKVFEYCLLDGSESFIGSSDNQYEFEKHTACSSAIYSVRKTVKYFVNGGSTVNLCAIDLSKAFYKVNHYVLLNEGKHT